MARKEFERIDTGVAKWPVHLNRKGQRVITLGLAAADRGAAIGRLQDALLESVELAKTAPSVGGPTTQGDIRHGHGYVDQWFTPSWVLKGCAIEKSVNYDYCIRSSRVRLVPHTRVAEAKFLQARRTVEQLCLV
jgi:hypothetical protein